MVSTKHLLLAINSLNLIFPIFGVIINTLYFFIKRKIPLIEKKIIYFGIVYSLAFIGYIYFRTNETGDVFRYEISLFYYKQSILEGRENIIDNLYETFYPIWYFILYLASILNFDIQFINYLATITIFGTMFFIVFKLSKQYPSIHSPDKHIVLKTLLFFSLFALLSSYKTAWAFSFVALGLFYLFNKNKVGWIFVFIGLGLHPIAIFPVIAYLLSNLVKFRTIYMFIAIFLGLIAKSFIITFSHLIEISFIGNKMQTYIYGDWAEYRFHDNSEYMLFFLMILFIVSIIFIILFKFYKKYNIALDAFQLRYTNFIFLYFALSLLFISFRTIEYRLLISGFIFFIPLFYQVFYFRKIFLNKNISFVFLIIWFFMIDFRTFNIFNDAYIIGSGFPLNIFDSPFILVFKGAL